MEVVILIWIVCGAAAGMIAMNRGANGCLWFVIGFMLGPIGLGLSFLSEAPAPKSRPGPDLSQRTCPFCRSLIPVDAVKCRHCASDVPPPPPIVTKYDGMGRPYSVREE